MQVRKSDSICRITVHRYHLPGRKVARLERFRQPLVLNSVRSHATPAQKGVFLSWAVGRSGSFIIYIMGGGSIVCKFSWKKDQPSILGFTITAGPSYATINPHS
jgi:hypothetical protein